MGDQDQREGAQQLREQPPPFPARVIEVPTVPELKLKYVVRAREGQPPALPGRSPGPLSRSHRPPTCGRVLARTALPAHRDVICHAQSLHQQHRRSFTMRTASPSRASCSTKPSSNIASLRNLSWNLAIWPAYLRSLSGTIGPRNGTSSIPLTGGWMAVTLWDSQLTGSGGLPGRVRRPGFAAGQLSGPFSRPLSCHPGLGSQPAAPGAAAPGRCLNLAERRTSDAHARSALICVSAKCGPARAGRA